jgi:hypothetical protein
MESQPAQGWWQASDGRWYHPDAADSDEVNPPAPPRWWENSVLVVLALLLCTVPGLVLLWLKRQWGLGTKLTVTGIILGLFLFGVKVQSDVRAARTQTVGPRAAAVAENGHLTRFGATQAEWPKYHQVNPYGRSGWDLDPRLPGGQSSRYTSIMVQAGRVSSLGLQLPDGTSADQALAEALTELPGDATVLWRADATTCSLVGVDSATLRQVAGTGIGAPPGRVLITLTTKTVYGDGFDPNNANRATLVAADIPQPTDPEAQCPR